MEGRPIPPRQGISPTTAPDLCHQPPHCGEWQRQECGTVIGHQVLEARDRVQESDDALAQLQATFSAVQDAETGQRGYLLTGEDAYLDPYRDATDVIRKRLAGLQELVAGGRLSAQTVKEANDLVTRRLAVLQQTVDLMQSGRKEPALAVPLSSIGDAVIITDTAGRITFISQVAEELTGWTARQVQEQPCAKVFNIINESSRQTVESPVDKVLASGAIVGLANHTHYPQ